MEIEVFLLNRQSNSFPFITSQILTMVGEKAFVFATRLRENLDKNLLLLEKMSRSFNSTKTGGLTLSFAT